MRLSETEKVTNILERKLAVNHEKEKHNLPCVPVVWFLSKLGIITKKNDNS